MAAIVHNLLNEVFNLCRLFFADDVIYHFLDEDLDNTGYGTVLKEDIPEVIKSGNVREQLNLLSKFFSSFVDNKIYFLLGTVLHDVYMTPEYRGVLNLNFDLLEKEYKLIPANDAVRGEMRYDNINGSYYFSFTDGGYVKETRKKNTRLQKTDEEIAQWDVENDIIQYLFDPSLSDREQRFLDVHKIQNVGERLYKNMEESGTANIFAKLADYFLLTDSEKNELLEELVKWMTQTRNHKKEHIILSFHDKNIVNDMSYCSL
ncbi:MAG: hypothetical protein Terrestrivirus5_50 [Terrestrivirus sp.]|uniref:Uncharacterized protein n=1 Tax=Terrestrivirus sp. TaxID=2487775 RepID=A0A3G4ZN00_9VIRU|nr:MAG: hypothetical protein Terrestrivirus5_50 [Terrestrivirus sp.]